MPFWICRTSGASRWIHKQCPSSLEVGRVGRSTSLLYFSTMATKSNGHANGTNGSNGTRKRQPLKPNGALDGFKTFEVTPAIGQEFPDVQIKDIISATNSDEILQEFARTVSTRGVVFFRNQDLTLAQQKEFANRIGKLSGRPENIWSSYTSYFQCWPGYCR